MSTEPENPPAPEHNPDGLTPEQYGAPEWRLLRSGEMVLDGDECYRINEKEWRAAINATGYGVKYRAGTYRRRVTAEHCDDCDPSQPCWATGADCRKRARTAVAPKPEAKDDPPFVAACNDAAHLAEAQYENLEAERRLLSDQAARIAELERLVEHLKTSILTLTNAAAQLTKERDEARADLSRAHDALDERDTLRARVAELESTVAWSKEAIDSIETGEVVRAGMTDYAARISRARVILGNAKVAAKGGAA